jgi:NTE family protein
VKGLTWQTVMSLIDVRVSGGLIEGSKLVEFFRSRFADEGIERLPRAFGCVATDLASGREVWLREGPVIDAVRASIALPGLLTPVLQDGRLLVDGGLVNPVPVSLCRAMGADLVIAVDLNADLLGRHLKPRARHAASTPGKAGRASLAGIVKARFEAGMTQLGLNDDDGEPDPPAMRDVLASSINIMQVLITRSRLAGEPADVLVTPRLADLELMAFHRAAVAIEAGRRAVEDMLPQLQARVNGESES